MKRVNVVVVLLILSSVGALGIYAAGTQEGAGQDVVTISMWDQFTSGGAGGTAAGPAFVKILAMWQEMRPDVKFERTVQKA